MCACSVTQACLTLRPVDCSPPGSSVHGISQARILEWVAISTAGDLTNPGIEPMSPASPALAGGFFTPVPPGKPRRFSVLSGVYPGADFLGHTVTLCSIFQESGTRLFFKVAASFLQSLQQSMGVPMALYPCQYLLLSVF